MLFGTSVVFLLLTYIPMFPAFLNLRKNDPNRERVFTFPFKGALMKVAIAVPCIELVLVIIATICPLSAAEIPRRSRCSSSSSSFSSSVRSSESGAPAACEVEQQAVDPRSRC